ncbi:MAG: DNA mismatch repair endonuclease MutL [Candidatus Dadabacteria bacterium]|nr:MAG: DNA mismatch repair endonuclease MutL [Candidatus Dadabacteria bacterium]
MAEQPAMGEGTVERIRPMPPGLSEVIAAGEVVERPASAIKELVENSLDAGASEILVEVGKGGKLRMVVDDNGRGIHPEDLPLAIARHATSKLTDADGLSRIRTFGFRGEALASLAAVSQLTIESRVETLPEGARLLARAGEIVEGPAPAPRRPGTRVTVEDLFANVPARRKFLRTDRTEAQKVRDILKIFTIAHPEVGFRLISDGREQLNVPPATLADRLSALHRRTRFVPVEIEGVRFRLTAMLSHPHDHQRTGANLLTFVNRRYVRDAMLRRAIQSAYDGAIPPGTWPLGAVFLDVLPEDVDVNVHPAKTEIRFLNPGTMFAEIRGAIRETLTATRRPPGFDEAAPATVAAPSPAARVAPSPSSRPSGRSGGFGGASVRGSAEPVLAYAAVEQEPRPAPSAAPLLDDAPDLDPLGALGDRYLLFREGRALVLVDQHAAHERIRYDRIMAAFDAERQPAQELLVPVVFEAEPAEFEGLRVGGDWLDRAGFAVEPFGPTSIRIRSVPRWFQGDPESAVRETLHELSRWKTPETLAAHAREIAASLACKGAILSGRKVPLVEQKALLEQLRRTPGADTCPHGRPVWRRMTMDELDRWFGR